MNSIEDRLDTLESVVDEQQAQIEAHEETIAAQQATIEAQRERLEALTDDDGGVSMPISRRGALTAGGALGLLGLGAGTASAQGSGQIGTADTPVDTVYTGNLRTQDDAIHIGSNAENVGQDTEEILLNFNLGVYEERTPLQLQKDGLKTGFKANVEEFGVEGNEATFGMKVAAHAFELSEKQPDPNDVDLDVGEGLLYLSDDSGGGNGGKLMFAFNDPDSVYDEDVLSVPVAQTHQS